MEKIKDLTKNKVERKVKKKRKLTSFKYNKKYTTYDNIHRLINFLGEREFEDNISIENYKELFGESLNRYGLEFIELSEEEKLSKIGGRIKNFSSDKYYSLNALDSNEKLKKNVRFKKIILGNVDSIFKGTFDSYVSYRNRIEGTVCYTPLSTKYLLGAFKLLDIVSSEIENYVDFYCSKDFSKISKFSRVYDKNFLVNSISVYLFGSFFTSPIDSYLFKGEVKRNMDISIYFALDCFFIKQYRSLNEELLEKYTEENEKECARAFETKKNIPKKILDKMNSSHLNKYFRYIEIDQDTDINKFSQIEREFEYLYNALDLKKFFARSSVELRVRKLGKHRALGIYFPSKTCICIDPYSPSSFLHEFAHFIDFTYSNNNLSMGLDFLPIVLEYRSYYNELIESGAEYDYLKSKKGYYTSTVEIFARSLEIYLSEKGVKTSFLKDKNDFKTTSGYTFKADTIKLITKYFDNLINISNVSLNCIEELNNMSKVSYKLAGEYKNPIMSKDNIQYTFDFSF